MSRPCVRTLFQPHIVIQRSKDGSQLSDWQIAQSRDCFVTLGEN